MNSISFPLSAVLELTYRCNHHCVFCSCPWYAPHNSYPKGKELNVPQWKKVVDMLYGAGVQTFSISGGEAILKEGMPEIVEHIYQEGKRRGYHHPIVLISNALAMKKEYLHLFKRCNVMLSMSLPGYSTFSEHTGVDNADGVLAWFSRAKALGLSTTANVTVTRKNIHELFETLSMALISGASSVLLNRFLPGGRGLYHQNELSLSTAQINEMMNVGEEVLTLANRYGKVGTEVARCAICHPDRFQHLSIGYTCAAAKGFFVIDPSGLIRTCNHSPHVVGHVFHSPIIDDMAYWNMFAHSTYKPAMCQGCEETNWCDCGCREVAHILKGNVRAVDPSIVNNTNSR